MMKVYEFYVRVSFIAFSIMLFSIQSFFRVSTAQIPYTKGKLLLAINYILTWERDNTANH